MERKRNWSAAIVRNLIFVIAPGWKDPNVSIMAKRKKQLCDLKMAFCSVPECSTAQPWAKVSKKSRPFFLQSLQHFLKMHRSCRLRGNRQLAMVEKCQFIANSCQRDLFPFIPTMWNPHGKKYFHPHMEEIIFPTWYKVFSPHGRKYFHPHMVESIFEAMIMSKRLNGSKEK